MPGEPELRGSVETSKANVTSIKAVTPAGTATGDLLLIAATIVNASNPGMKTPSEASVIAASAQFGTGAVARTMTIFEKVASATDVVNGFVTLEVEGASTVTKLIGVVVAIKVGTFKSGAAIDNHTSWTVEESATPQYGSIVPNHALSLALGFGSFTGVLSSDPPAEWTSVQAFSAEAARVISHACGESTAKTPGTTIGKSNSAASAWLMLTVASSAVGGPVTVRAGASVKTSGFGLSAGSPVVGVGVRIRTVIASKGGPVTVRAGASVGVFGPPVIYEPVEIGVGVSVQMASEPVSAHTLNVKAGARVSAAGVRVSGGAPQVRVGVRVGVKVVVSLTPPTRMVIRGTTTTARLRGG